MSDFFTLLNLPTSLSTDISDVDEAWRAKTKALHPDSVVDAAPLASDDGGISAELNEARRVLSEPVLRLEHWLGIQTPGFSKSVAIDSDLMDIFSEVNTALAKADEIIGKLAASTTDLGKAVLAKGAISAQLEIQGLLAGFRKKTDDVVSRFSEFGNAGAVGNFDPGISALGRLNFLKKWEKECQDRLLALISLG